MSVHPYGENPTEQQRRREGIGPRPGRAPISDEELQRRAQIALSPMVDLNVSSRVVDGVLYLEGAVDSELDREEAERLVARIPGVNRIVNQVAIDPTGYEAESFIEEIPEEDMIDEVSLDDMELAEEEGAEPSFTGRPGTTDVTEMYDMDPIFFAPTDPVVHDSDREHQGMEVRAGWAPTSTSEPRYRDQDPPQFSSSDYELQERVIHSLRNDAATQDLNVRVGVHDGIVYLRGKVSSLDDVENAEAVAGDVEGVVEVIEELEIE